jgi:hypothetical protein
MGIQRSKRRKRLVQTTEPFFFLCDPESDGVEDFLQSPEKTPIVWVRAHGRAETRRLVD